MSNLIIGFAAGAAWVAYMSEFAHLLKPAAQVLLTALGG